MANGTASPSESERPAGVGSPSKARADESSNLSGPNYGQNGMGIGTDHWRQQQQQQQEQRSSVGDGVRRGGIFFEQGKLQRSLFKKQSKKRPKKRLRGTRTSKSKTLLTNITDLPPKLVATLERGFRRHGRYISKHPIQTLLVACLIITSLFYPAVGIYLWSSKGGPGVTRGDARSVWRSLSTPLLDSFASSGRKHHNSLRDLRMIWDDAPDLSAVDARDARSFLGAMTPSPLGLFAHPYDEDDEEKDGEGRQGREDTRAREAKKSKRCRTVIVEHVFVTTDDVMLGLGPRYGALDVPILHSALNLQRAIEANLSQNHFCVQPGKLRREGIGRGESEDEEGGCLSLSPLAFWSYDDKALTSDVTPTSTILKSNFNLTSQGVPLSLTTTLAGRSHLFTKLPRAEHLALTFFLETDDEDSCNSNSNLQSVKEQQLSSSKTRQQREESESHRAWIKMLQTVTGGQVSIVRSEHKSAKELQLQFVPGRSKKTSTRQGTLLAVGYIAVLVWISRSLMRMRKVHSRFGLAFTGIIELGISMTLAVSVCALSGIRLTLVPWEILPFVVVVIGSENMFTLTQAVYSTPVSLTVPSRIAAGLSKVGVPVTVTVLSDVLLMSTIAMVVDVRAVREFCIFAIFSLVVDFFMQMTFYVTVLSIDMQRLELADLLSQGGLDGGDNDDNVSITSSSHGLTSSDEGEDKRKRGASSSKNIITMSCRTMWRARTARTLSLSLLLALMFGIYLYHGSGYPTYHSYPFKEQNSLSIASSSTRSSTPVSTTMPTIAAFDPFAHLGSEVSRAPWWHDSPSAAFWQALNPDDAPSVRVLVEPWTVVSLRSSGTGNRPNVIPFASWALFRPRVRAIIWFIKLVILPIAGTTAILWVVLLYLLKDTELLDAQRNKSDAGDGAARSSDDDHDDEDAEGGLYDEDGHEQDDLEVNLSIGPKMHEMDVELVVSSGGYIVSAATGSSLSVWRPSTSASSSASAKRSSVVRQFPSMVITALDVSADADLVAIGSASGVVTLLHLATLRPYQPSSPSLSSAVSGRVQYVKILLSKGEFGHSEAKILSVHRNGDMYTWGVSNGPSIVQQGLQGASGVLWTAFDAGSHVALCSSDHRMMVGRVIDNHFEVVLNVEEEAGVYFRCAALSSLSFARAGDSKSVTRSGSSISRTVLAGTTKGSIIAWDIASGEEVARMDMGDGPVTRLKVVASSQLAAFSSRRGGEQSRLIDLVVASTSSMETVLALGTIQSQEGKGKGHQQQDSLAPPSPTHMRTPMRRLGSASSGLTNGGSLSPDAAVAQTNGFERHQRIGSHSSRRRSFADQTSSVISHDDSRDSFEDEVLMDGEEEMGELGAGVNALVRLASVANPRGGADVVGMQDRAAKLQGVCRRTDSTTSNGDEDRSSSARWELWQMDLSRLLLLYHQQQIEPTDGVRNDPIVGGWKEHFTTRIPLDIEDHLIGEATRLSFTRIRASSVQCVENRPTSPLTLPSSSLKKKSKLTFSFGDTVALLKVTTPSMAAIPEKSISASPIKDTLRRRRKQRTANGSSSASSSKTASPSTPNRLSLPRR